MLWSICVWRRSIFPDVDQARLSRCLSLREDRALPARVAVFRRDEPYRAGLMFVVVPLDESVDPGGHDAEIGSEPRRVGRTVSERQRNLSVILTQRARTYY